MAKSSKIVVSKRTEAAFKKVYKYKNKSLQAFIGALIKDRDKYYQHFLDTTTQFPEFDVDFKHSMTEAA